MAEALDTYLYPLSDLVDESESEKSKLSTEFAGLSDELPDSPGSPDSLEYESDSDDSPILDDDFSFVVLDDTQCPSPEPDLDFSPLQRTLTRQDDKLRETEPEDLHLEYNDDDEADLPPLFRSLSYWLHHTPHPRGWTDLTLAQHLYTLARLVRPLRALRLGDLFAQKLAQIGTPDPELTIQNIKWEDPEIQEFNREDPPSLIRRGPPSYLLGTPVLSRSQELPTQFVVDLDFSSNFDLSDTSVSVCEIYALVKYDGTCLYEDLERYFEAALLQIKTAAFNLAEALKLTSNFTKYVNNLARKMQASQIRYNELEEYIKEEPLQYSSLDDELVFHMNDCVIIQTDLRKVRGYYESVRLFLDNKLNFIYEGVANAISIGENAESIYLKFIAANYDSLSDDRLSFNCYSSFSLFKEVLVQKRKEVPQENFGFKLRLMDKILVELEEIGAHMLSSSRATHKTFTNLTLRKQTTRK